jgi:PAS domain-containing protein
MGSLFSTNYLPHQFCYLSQPGLIWTNVLSDGLIALSYGLIFGCLFWVVGNLRRIPEIRPYLWMFLSFGTFIAACGVTHVMEVVTVWWPFYPLSASTKAVCAAVSVPTAILFALATPRLAANIHLLLDGLRAARCEQDDIVANYKGQIEAINRTQMMIEFEMDGTILHANDNYLRAFGLTNADIAGKDHSIFVTEEHRKSNEYKAFWEDLRAGRYHIGEFLRVGKEGQPVWIEAS